MSGNELIENLTEKKKVITDHAQEAITNKVSNILKTLIQPMKELNL